MLNLDRPLAAPGGVLRTSVEDGAVLLDTRTSRYFTLNEVGARLWQLLGEGRSPAEAVPALLSEYDVEPARLEQDVRELLGELIGRGLLEESQDVPAQSAPAAPPSRPAGRPCGPSGMPVTLKR